MPKIARHGLKVVLRLFIREERLQGFLHFFSARATVATVPFTRAASRAVRSRVEELVGFREEEIEPSRVDAVKRARIDGEKSSPKNALRFNMEVRLLVDVHRTAISTTRFALASAGRRP